MNLHLLPTHTAGAVENMAVDFLLLQRYPEPEAPRFRHYEWRGPAFTFGYAQKIAFVREQLPPGETFDLCRRPTGGGIVDHREDWTYALVIPRGHPLEEQRATQSYRAVHEALANALRTLNVAAITKRTEDAAADEDNRDAGVCFQRAELFDVVHEKTGAKIAGAAQKRNKHGLLFQGSVWRPSVGNAAVDWDEFQDRFTAELAKALGATPQITPWPEFNDGEVEGLTEQYSSPDWIEYR
jgi:lipoyl(octanoyl) transferase